jgi:DNA-binding transcriptional MerR regulator
MFGTGSMHGDVHDIVVVNSVRLPKEILSLPQNEPLYTVTQLAAELGITVRTLHFYEAQGLLAPRRAGTTRVYTQRDRARMIIIMRGKRLGFSIREIKEYLELYEVDPTQREQVKVLLKSVHNRIHRLEEQRIAVDETLVELRTIEREALAALAALRSVAGGPVMPDPRPRPVTKTKVKTDIKTKPNIKTEASRGANANGAKRTGEHYEQ